MLCKVVGFVVQILSMYVRQNGAAFNRIQENRKRNTFLKFLMVLGV